MYKLIRNGRKVKGMGADNIFRLYPLKFILVIKTKSEREKKINRRTRMRSRAKEVKHT